MDSLFQLKGCFPALEDAPLWILPLLMPSSTISPVSTSSVNPTEELPIRWLKKGPIKVPIKMSISSLSVKGGCTLPAKSLHFWAYSLKPSLEHMVIVIGGSGTDCLTLVHEMSRKQELPPSFIFSNMERTKAQKNSFSRCFSGSGGRFIEREGVSTLSIRGYPRALRYLLICVFKMSAFQL